MHRTVALVLGMLVALSAAFFLYGALGTEEAVGVEGFAADVSPVGDAATPQLSAESLQQPDAADVVPADRSALLPATLARASTWSGRIEAQRTRAPIAGAVIQVRHGELVFEAHSDESGAFVVDALREPGASLHVAHSDYVDLREAEPDFSDGRVLVLRPSGSIRGIVEGAVRPDDGLQIALWRSTGQRFDGEPLESVPPEKDRSFRFLDLEPGTYGLGAVGGSGPLVFLDGVVVVEGEQALVALTVPSGLVLQGRVVVGKEQRAVEDAEITLMPEIQGINDGVERLSQRVVQSSANGDFEIPGLAQGGVDLVVRTPWGAERRGREDISIYSTQEERLFVFPEPAHLSGLVRTPDGGPASAMVALVAEGDQRGMLMLMDKWETGGSTPRHLPFMTTSADGRFTFDAIPSNLRRAWLVALPQGSDSDGLAPVAQRIDNITPDQSIEDLELTLRTSQPVSGRVLDDEEQPVAGARVELRIRLASDRRTVAEQTTGPDGTFMFASAVLEGGGLFATKDGYQSRWVNIDDSPAGEPIELLLETALSVHGRVVDTNGAAVPDVVVSLRKGNERNRGRGRNRGRVSFGRSDEYGRFEIKRIEPGDYVAGVQSTGSLVEADPIPVRVPFEDELIIEVRVAERETPVNLGGEVTDAMTGASVPSLRLDGIGNALVRIDGIRFDVQGMPPGPTTIVLKADGYENAVVEARNYSPGEHVELGAFEMWPAGRLRVRVMDTEGKTIQRASVRLHPLPHAEGGTGLERGMIQLSENRRDRNWPFQQNVPKRAFELEVRRNGYKPYRKRLVIDGRRQNKTIRLRKKD